MSSVQEDAQDRVSTGGSDAAAADPDEDKLVEARDDIGDLVQIENKSHQPGEALLLFLLTYMYMCLCTCL